MVAQGIATGVFPSLDNIIFYTTDGTGGARGGEKDIGRLDELIWFAS